MIGDLVPLSQRQVMIGRLLSATIAGNLLGAAAAGIVADIIHWRGFEPSDPRRGASKLETLREALAADIASRQAVTEQFKAGLTAPGYISRPLDAPILSPEAHDRLTKDMSNRFAKRQMIGPTHDTCWLHCP